MRLQIGVTAYEVTSERGRHIEGVADVDGDRVSYEVDVENQKDPVPRDRFTVRLSNGYEASGTLRRREAPEPPVELSSSAG